ncbi:uncharacterized protein CG1161-like [Pollicipes pollicipes]|uniref:uncharacterized protein CG1161-like n=1 Tax=Pollicipes pollicipes TaxID=41117 RepID=UPI0018856176|nr:uncharacterized protein CG1161-like [Pollicipes pollicipes]
MHSAAMFSALLIIVASFTIHDTEALYEDVRCKCVCPNPNVVNGSSSDRKLYIANVAPNLCNCDNVILPELPANFSKSREFCPLCECKFESRNTTTIKVVVILIICIISVLVIYMTFLSCLDPILNKRRATSTYQEQTNDEDELSGRMAQPLYEQGSVLNRVGNRQDRWKRQVQEQRNNIYVRRTMLN